MFEQHGRSLSGPAGRPATVHGHRPRGAMNRIAGAALALALVAAGVEGSPAVAGHGISHYPSYFPDEIRIEAVDPATAALGLERKTLHAYIGGTPAFDGRAPAHVKALRSLGSFLVLAFGRASPRNAIRIITFFTYSCPTHEPATW